MRESFIPLVLNTLACGVSLEYMLKELGLQDLSTQIIFGSIENQIFFQEIMDGFVNEARLELQHQCSPLIP
jgi:hypothetical protein